MRVKVTRAAGSVLLSSDDSSIQVWIGDGHSPNEIRNDFAAWFFLPIAMRSGMDLSIEGEGSEETARNARRLSEIWESWLPHHFNSVNVVFDHASSRPHGPSNGNLCLYSGGVDSTHALLTRHRSGKKQNLLTVHGLDYKFDDEETFRAFKDKTTPFSRLVGTEHIFVRTNAYAAYRKWRVNPAPAHISHIFALAGAAFIFSERHDDLHIAADYRLDQQFITHPWGSNSATNVYFDDGLTRLKTLDDHLTRIEKLPLIMASEEALASVTFCGNYRSRPFNCGRCQKCTRTKVMFFVETGRVPEIFADVSIAPNWHTRFDFHKSYQRAFLLDIVTSARRNHRLEQLPEADVVFSMLKTPAPKERRKGKVGRGIFEILTGVTKRFF